ncbi:MAG TPA: BPSS1780 family membrane protein [Telluria sp.]|jgi:hypothetical protein
MSTLPARTGWDWLKQGMALFRKQPAALTTLLFANVLASIFLSFVPVLGPLLGPVLIPSFSIAFMQACLMIENGDRVTPAVLLTGFRRPALGALCKIGLIYLGVWMTEMVIVVLVLGPEFFEEIARRQIDAKAAAEPMSTGVLVFFLIALLNMGMLVMLYFAAPLAYWKRMATGKALFYSFFAVVRSARVFLVLLAAWFGILLALVMVAFTVFGDAALGRVVGMWLIFLFVLLLQCAMYAGYRTIFGKPVDGTAQPA